MDELAKIRYEQVHRRFVLITGPKCRDRIVILAKLLLKTCPDNWDSGTGICILVFDRSWDCI
ncbi:hypothetical protein CI238_11170 [Colletotrichum incanum]|uniref:Uncharacterized protein n=1 Tax=Colletotrichum incanum TaxID=1573173 RepID=A0A162NEM7_COLIC|nr:hypothetical protein CI238_11170 [Colletotrichum incanum]